ncbi:MAG: hypothetical protein R3C11_06170 [Planctomycetaceae bacterium]
MKKLFIFALAATLLAVGAQMGIAKPKEKSEIPAEVGYFYVPGQMKVVSHLEEARLQKDEPQLLTVSFQDAPPAEPLTVYPETPTSVYSESVTSSEPVQLYHCAKVEDRHNIHPCAVTKIVSVLDPCPQPCCGAAVVDVVPATAATVVEAAALKAACLSRFVFHLVDVRK